MAIEPAAELAVVEDLVAEAHRVGDASVAGIAPSRLALRRLRRNRSALAFGALFLLVVATCLAAPLYAHHVAHTDAYANHITETVTVDGEPTNVIALNGVPIGPTWHGRFFLGADDSGRDIAVRLLYGGRTSLLIGGGAALITILLAILAGVLAGYLGGWVDTIISRIMDVIWPFPPVLLGVALGTALALGGLKIGALELSGGSLALPVLIIGVIYAPYMARPLRGQVLALREKEFVEAARAQGLGPIRIMFSEILPNLSSTIVVFAPLIVANAILLEAGLSFLGAGVQPPTPSWGTMISVGVNHMVTGPHQAIVPGLMLVITVLALNIFGDGVRDAFDPRAKVRVER
jgi:peptide/nickel transport system permease protein